MISAVPGTI